ncbi:MAG: capsule assembly Wzi family protein [Steroidobacterales bacterium]
MSRGRCGAWTATLLLAAGLAGSSTARASGVSPYLPLNLSPEIERKIERVLILGGQPVLTRPVAVDKVMLALPKARRLDRPLCAEVERYLDRYFKHAAVTHASAEVAAAKHSLTTLPNERGERADSPWDASVAAYYRPGDYLLLTAAAVGYGGTDGRVNPAGSMASVGNEYLQLDAGYRDHWLSPLTDSSMLVSTEAPTLPSVTLSNQRPITGLGLQYEFFLARMSYTNQILWHNALTAGYPRLAGLHLGIEPVDGWAISGNGTWQFGGGARPGSLTQLFKSLFKSTQLSTSSTGTNTDSRFANRQVSITSAYTFPAPQPFAAYVEYAGRDSLHGSQFRFRDAALSAGVHFPKFLQRFDLTLETSEIQDSWYTDYVWLEGMTVNGYVTGNWAGDWRTFSDAVGAQTGMAQLGWSLQSGDEINLRYRTLQNRGYSASLGFPAVDYRRANMLTAEYAQPRDGYTRGLSLDLGSDVYGKSFARLAAFVRFDGGNQDQAAARLDSDEAEQTADAQDTDEYAQAARLERFVDAGVSGGRLGLDLGGFSAAQEAASAVQYRSVISPHLGVGVRRAVSEHGDLGVRAEFDDFHAPMVALRVLDYRYRLDRHFAIGAFFGFVRYAGPTPALGYYEGAGLQWRDLWPHWDLSLDARIFDHVQRNKLLPSDPQNGDPVEWYTMQVPTLYLSRRF